MRSLDSPETYSMDPYRRAFKIAEEFVEDLRRGLDSGRGVDLEIGSAEEILLVGIGGSGIVCDVVAQILSGRGMRVKVLKGYSSCGGGWDLALIVSHSGNTAEAVKHALALLEERIPQAFITSDGILAKLAERYGVPLAPVRGDVPPRYGFPSMLGAVLGILEKMGLMRTEIRYDELERFRSEVREDSPSEENPAKRLALRIAEAFPIVYAYEEVRSAGYRLKCQLNENAKIYCGFAEIPEAFHNDLEALPRDCLIILPRSFREEPDLSKAIEAFTSLVGEEKVSSIRVESRDELEELLKLFLFMDYTSLYAAVLRGSDPLTLPRLDEFKRRNKAYDEILGEAERRLAGG
ncbi:MAG TPA: hypothetical protein ENF79_05370 [Nitrososphaeria archaeon]|nr:hypothetical protein [Nitrososphaeria archaeon]